MTPSIAMGLLFLPLLFMDPQYLEGKQHCFENREISIHILFPLSWLSGNSFHVYLT
jgi:hypothetical protein